MNKSAGITRVHGWRMRDLWMFCKPIGKGKLVGLILDPRKEVSKSRGWQSLTCEEEIVGYTRVSESST